MEIVEINTRDPHQARQFLDLPFKIYQDIPQWVPPLAFEASAMLDRARYPFYRHSEAAFFLAISGKQAVGRLAVLNNRNYNQYQHDQRAFFYLFECQDDPAAAQALFTSACAWARARGLNTLYGPKGFTALDGMGLLVRGFDYPPAFGIPYNPHYYPALIENCGLYPDGEIVSGYLNGNAPFPEKIHAVAERVQQRRGLHVARFQKRAELKRLLPALRELYNGAIQGTPGNVPLTQDEAKTLADQLLWFADPRLIKIIMKHDRPVGFLFAYPDISAAVRRTHGRLLPFGWLHLLLEMRRTEWVNINGAGILEEYRGLGGTALLFSEMHHSIRERPFKHCEIVQIGADNERMLNELRSLGVNFYKAHRMYRMAIL